MIQFRSDPFYDFIGVFPNVRTIGNGLLDGHFSESNNIRVRNIFFCEVLPLLFPHGTSVSRLSKLEGESTGLTTCKTGTVNEARTNAKSGRREKSRVYGLFQSIKRPVCTAQKRQAQHRKGNFMPPKGHSTLGRAISLHPVNAMRICICM